jgi:hypothetical protein
MESNSLKSLSEWRLRLLVRRRAPLWSFPPRLHLVKNTQLEETSTRVGRHLANPGLREVP